MWFKTLKTDIPAFLSFWFLGLVIAAAVCAPCLTPYDPLDINLDTINQRPSAVHLLGTDNQGRDILSRVIYGSRYSLSVGIIATFISLLLGIIIGLVSGYIGGLVDKCLVVIIDITMAFPSLLLAIGISVVMRSGMLSVIIALSLVGWTSFARLVRSTVIELKEKDFVQAARSLGCPFFRIVTRHILPNCLPIIITATSLNIGGFILSESALSFLGLGIQPPTPTWGSMINLGRDYIRYQPFMTIAPGMAIAVTIVAFNLLGEFIQNYVNPKTMKRTI